MRLYITAILLFTILSCSNKIDNNYVKAQTWSYEGGFKVGQGDFIQFDSAYNIFSLRNDTIIYRGTPRAIIVALDKKNFHLEVRSIDGKEKGEYRDIAESLQ